MATTHLSLDSRAARTPAPLPLRGIVVAAIVVGLGVFLINPLAAGVTWGDFAILGVMAVTAILGANQARRLVLSREPEAAPVASDGPWMTVVIGDQGPASTAGQIVEPKAPPRKDPERRGLARRARERQATFEGRRR